MGSTELLVYLGAAVILCTVGRFLEWRCSRRGSSPGKVKEAIIMICYGISFPVYGALQALERSTAKQHIREYDEAIKAAATIAAIEALPSDMRESAWQRDAWREWHTNMSYDEWYASISNKCGFDELLFSPSTSARWEIEKLRNELESEHTN